MTYKHLFQSAAMCIALSFAACAQPMQKEPAGADTASFGSATPAETRAPAPAQGKYVLHKANTRGETNAGWLLAKHSFSFNDYYDPERMNFGALRVLNDDLIGKGSKFPMHSHANMEIISVPLEGGMAHKDDMGHSGVIRAGDVQIMSAGTGITHSEANESKKDTLKSLQIWVLPNKGNVKPRYQQLNGILANQPQNTFKRFVSPTDSNALFLYQNAVFSMGRFAKSKKTSYKIAFEGNGVYAFVIEGSAKINGVEVGRRDGIGVWGVQELTIEATSDLRVLLMDVPMID